MPQHQTQNKQRTREAVKPTHKKFTVHIYGFLGMYKPPSWHSMTKILVNIRFEMFSREHQERRLIVRPFISLGPVEK